MITAMMNNEKTGESILFIVLEPILKNPPERMPPAERSGTLELARFPWSFSVLVAYDPNEVEDFIKARGIDVPSFHWVRTSNFIGEGAPIGS